MKAVNWQEVMSSCQDLKSAGLTAEEERNLRSLLLKIEIGGRLSLPVFLWSRAAFVSPALEGIFLRRTAKGVETLLKMRPENDPVYFGKLDVFGTVLLPGDVLTHNDPDWETNPYRIPLQRILKEAMLSKFGASPRIVGGRLFEGDRGPVNQTIAICEVPDDETPKGDWYPVDNLPEAIIWEHRSLIALAIKHY